MNPQQRLCPNCNHLNRQEARFCTACGALQEPRACARCGVGADPGDRYCRACGGLLNSRAVESAKTPPAAAPAAATTAAAPVPPAAAAKPPAPQPELNGEDAEVYERLRRWRTEQSGVEGVPRYAVFNNAQLAEIAKAKPSTQPALAAIKGIGAAKAQKYFEAVKKVLTPGGEVKERKRNYVLA